MLIYLSNWASKAGQWFEIFVKECKSLTTFQWLTIILGIGGVISLLVALKSQRSMKRLMDRVVETYPLLDPKEIFAQCVQALTEVRDELMIMAGVPAIGFTGAKRLYHTRLRGTMVDTADRLKSKFHFTLYDQVHWESFYGDGNAGRKDIELLLEENRALLEALRNSGPINERLVDRIPMLHFLLVDSRTKRRKAIIWVIKHAVDKKGRVRIKTVGFYTRSEEIINTLRSFYVDFPTLIGQL